MDSRNWHEEAITLSKAVIERTQTSWNTFLKMEPVIYSPEESRSIGSWIKWMSKKGLSLSDCTQLAVDRLIDAYGSKQ